MISGLDNSADNLCSTRNQKKVARERPSTPQDPNQDPFQDSILPSKYHAARKHSLEHSKATPTTSQTTIARSADTCHALATPTPTD